MTIKVLAYRAKKSGIALASVRRLALSEPGGEDACKAGLTQVSAGAVTCDQVHQCIMNQQADEARLQHTSHLGLQTLHCAGLNK